MNPQAILLSMASACVAAFAYPYLLYPLALRLQPRRPISIGATQTSVSLLFCAFNEAEALPNKLENLRALKRRRPELQILAYDDGSTDGTYDLLVAHPELLTVIRGAGRSGKVAGMQRLVAKAQSEILVFTDANVIFAEDAIDQLLPYYADPSVGGVCGTLEYSTDPGSVTAEVGSLYWTLDERLRTLESNTGNVMGADGSIFSMRRSLYPQLPGTVQDDFAASMHVIFAGRRLVKAPTAVAYERSVSRRREEVRRKVRISAGAYHTHLFMRSQLRKMPLLDRFKYASRKLMRWYGGAFLILAAFFALSAATLSSAAVGGALFASTAVGALFILRARHGLLAKAGEVLVAVYATLFGVIRAKQGVTFATWAPAKSR